MKTVLSVLFVCIFQGVGLSATPLDLTGYTFHCYNYINTIGFEQVQLKFNDANNFTDISHTFLIAELPPRKYHTPQTASYTAILNDDKTVTLALNYAYPDTASGILTFALKFTSETAGIVSAPQNRLEGPWNGRFRLSPPGYDKDGLGTYNTSQRVTLKAGIVSTIGFVINGTGPRMVLIRGVCKSLAQFGVSSIASGVDIKAFAGDKVSGDVVFQSWSSTDLSTLTLKKVFDRCGAFQLNANSGEQVDYTQLVPGPYTLQVKLPAGATEGDCLIEVYVSP